MRFNEFHHLPLKLIETSCFHWFPFEIKIFILYIYIWLYWIWFASINQRKPVILLGSQWKSIKSGAVSELNRFHVFLWRPFIFFWIFNDFRRQSIKIERLSLNLKKFHAFSWKTKENHWFPTSFIYSYWFSMNINASPRFFIVFKNDQ